MRGPDVAYVSLRPNASKIPPRVFASAQTAGTELPNLLGGRGANAGGAFQTVLRVIFKAKLARVVVLLDGRS
jgi:hypothetical protein